MRVSPTQAQPPSQIPTAAAMDMAGMFLRTEMNTRSPRSIRLRRVIGLVVSLCVSVAFAATWREQIAAGIAHYEAGRYEEALAAFEQAATAAPPAATAELLHNRAAAQFKLGKIEDARELWVQAAAQRDAAFEARARYNLGNCAYSDAQRAAESGDLTGALQRLDSASEHYRDALRLDPGFSSARANLELAQKLKRELKEQAENQSQPSSQPDSQPSSQPQSQPSSQPQEQSDQQESSDQQDSQSQSQPSSQPQSQPATQPRDDQQQTDQPQSQPATQPQEGNPQEEPEEPQSQPADQPEPQSQPAPQPAETQPADSQPSGDESPQALPNIQLTREEAERLLQRIRDAEAKRRRELLRRQIEMQKPRPVERDW